MKDTSGSRTVATATHAIEPYVPRGSKEPSQIPTFDAEVHWSVTQELSPLAPFRQQLIGSFLSSQLPEKMLKETEEKPWLLLLSELPSPSLALEKSTLAICTARLGRLKSDDLMVRRSLRLYTEGLCELQKALYDPKLMYKDETLAACMGLATYELMECPLGNTYAYASHHKGCARLIQLRGVYAHTSGLGRQLFMSFRTQSILNALEDHRTTYLSDPTWLTVPWKQTGKTHFDELLDIVSVAPAIFSRVDQFDFLEPQEKLPAALAVIEVCWKVDARLQGFYDRFESSTLGPLYWPEHSKESASQDDHGERALFPIAYQFPDVQIAKTLVLYWSVATMLWTGMTRLYHLSSALSCSSGISLSSHSLPSLQHRSDFMVPARNVFQSVEFLMQDRMLGLGPQSIVAPLSIVVETIRDFPEYAREVTWADFVMDEIRGRGLQILRYSVRR